MASEDFDQEFVYFKVKTGKNDCDSELHGVSNDFDQFCYWFLIPVIVPNLHGPGRENSQYLLGQKCVKK